MWERINERGPIFRSIFKFSLINKGTVLYLIRFLLLDMIANSIHLVILVSFNHIGDYNQALIVERLYKKSASHIFSTVLLNVDDH